MKKYDVTALGELLIDFTENGKSNQGNPLFEANPGGAGDAGDEHQPRRQDGLSGDGAGQPALQRRIRRGEIWAW